MVDHPPVDFLRHPIVEAPVAGLHVIDRNAETPGDDGRQPAVRIAEEQEAVRYLESAAPDRVRTWTVPEAGHTEGLSQSPDEWEQRVISFLAAELGPT